MKIKSSCSLALMAATGALLITGASLRASDTDSSIESSVKKSYVFRIYLKDDSIKTESTNGVVTLTGTVADASHKSLAGNTVENLPGVASVDNQLQIVGTNPAEYSDVWLSTRVRTTFMFHRSVNAAGTDVHVQDGIVRLRGAASSLAQKELTGVYAEDVEGVKEVHNEMTIAPAPAQPAEITGSTGEKIDDASITAQVKTELRTHRSTSAIHTMVSTKDGVVALSGIARNDAERSLVTKLATDIYGVTSVINNMTLAVPVALAK